MRPPRAAVALAAASSLALVGAALAASSGSFVDPTGDTARAPDVGAVSYSSDDAGDLTVRVAVGNRASGLTGDDEVLLGIDSDQSPETGAVFYGADAAITLGAGTVSFLRPTSAGYLGPAAKPASVQASFAAGIATFTFAAADVDVGPAGGFNLIVHAIGSGFGDSAPDFRTVNHQLVAGAPPVVPGPDRRAPLDVAVKSRAKRGKVAHLDYFAADARGVTADTIRVYRGRRLLRRILIRLEDASPFTEYYASWRVPRRIRGKLRFCVSSIDAAGNKSNVSCAPIVLG